MRRDVHVDDAASVVRQDDEHEQHVKRGGRDREEVDRGELGDVIREERAPRLRRRTTATPEVLPTVACDTSMSSFCNSPWAGRSAEWVRFTHLADQGPEVRRQRRATDAAGSRVPAPISGERAAMPMLDRGGRHDLRRRPPVRPNAREQHPEQPIDRDEGAVVLARSVAAVMFADAHDVDVVVDPSDLSFRPAPSIDASRASIHGRASIGGVRSRPSARVLARITFRTAQKRAAAVTRRGTYRSNRPLGVRATFLSCAATQPSRPTAV